MWMKNADSMDGEDHRLDWRVEYNPIEAFGTTAYLFDTPLATAKTCAITDSCL